MEEVLKEIYYNPKHPGSFGGVQRLYREASKTHSVTEEQVKDFLSKQNVFTLHKDRRFNFKRNRVLALYKDYGWEADLIDMQAYAEENEGHKYILVVIDIFTKFCWLRAIKTKTPAAVCEAFSDIFSSSKRVPHRLRTDRGNEFQSRVNEKFYRDHDILYFTSTNQTVKCSIVERLNRTLKSRFFRYFSSKGHHRYMDVLHDFEDNYNTSYHRSIRMTPTEACDADPKLVFSNIYGGKSLDQLFAEKEVPVAEEGDIVRLRYPKDTFDKSYLSTFTDQTATVDKVIKKPVPLYSLRDYKNKVMPQNFYKHEVQVIPEPSYRVERVLRTRTRNGVKEYFVKFLNYPSSENSWVKNLGDV